MKLSSKFQSLNQLSKLVKNNSSIGIGGHHFARLPISLINKVLSHNPKNLEFIREDVQDKVNQNFPNIDIEELEVFATENANTIKINLIYSIPNTGINDTLELNFS